MCAKRACGGHEELMAAIDSGEIKETTDPKTGRRIYITENAKAGHFKKKKHKIKIGGGVTITPDMAMKADEALKQIGFCFIAKSVND